MVDKQHGPLNLGGPYQQGVQIDPLISGLLVTGDEDYMINHGMRWSSANTARDVPSAASVYVTLHVITPVHVQFAITTGADSIITFYNDPVINQAGDELNVFNRQSTNGHTTDMTLTSGATFTNLGSEVGTSFIPGGATKQTAGGGAGSFDKVALSSGLYLLQIENISNTDMNVGLDIGYYHDVVHNIDQL